MDDLSDSRRFRHNRDEIVGLNEVAVFVDEHASVGVAVEDNAAIEALLPRQRGEPFEGVPVFVEAADQPGLLLNVPEGGLGAAYIVPHGLAGNTELLGDLTQ